MPGSLATDLVVRQLHRGQRRDEQLGNTDHVVVAEHGDICLLYTSPSPRDGLLSRMPSSA